MKKVFEHPACQNLQILHLQDCTLKDAAFATMLEGLHTGQALKVIVYKNNEFGPLALQQLKPILERSYPHHLEELKLISCISGTRSPQIDQLLTFIRDEQC
jgi:Ran GTPase-activating protein (RanGAP) involved in mRNA processing and transport